MSFQWNQIANCTIYGFCHDSTNTNDDLSAYVAFCLQNRKSEQRFRLKLLVQSFRPGLTLIKDTNQLDNQIQSFLEDGSDNYNRYYRLQFRASQDSFMRFAVARSMPVDFLRWKVIDRATDKEIIPSSLTFDLDTVEQMITDCEEIEPSEK